MGTGRRVEELVCELAARQHGLVTRAQLLECGLGADGVQYRVETKRLVPVQRGIYRVGPLVAPHAANLAAVLACGPGALLSDWSAAAMWRLIPAREDPAPVDVTVRAGDRRRRRPGIRVHRRGGLRVDEATKLEGIPITTAARTLLDLAATLDGRPLEQAVARAERAGLTTYRTILAIVDRHFWARGTQPLRKLLSEIGEPAFTRSDAEEELLGLIRKARLPVPELNAKVAGHQVDFVWRAERLVVEVDGFAFHSSREHFEDDRSRDADLSARGIRVMRVTWRQLVGEREATLVRVAQALAASMRSWLGASGPCDRGSADFVW